MKSIFTFILLFTTAVAFAQNKKGNLLVGVNIGSGNISSNEYKSGDYVSSNLGKSKTNSFGIDVLPMVGFYLSDKVVVGGTAGLGYYSTKTVNSSTAYPNDISTSKQHDTHFMIGPYARFYWGNGKRGMPFAEINGAITFYIDYKYSYKSTGLSWKTDYEHYHPISVGAKFGYEHFINTVVGIQYYLGYDYSSYDYDYSQEVTSTIVTTRTGYEKSHTGNFNFGAGLVIHLECSKKKNK